MKITNKFLSVILMMCLILTSQTALAFPDVAKEDYAWAMDAIETLATDGILAGFPDGKFYPDENVTHAEFAKMLTLSLDLNGEAADFSDIDGHWAYDYITSAGDVFYSKEGIFAPDSDATRAYLAYAAAEALSLSDASADEIDKFTDASLIADDMKLQIANAAAKGIIIGYEDATFRPDELVSRAEAAVIIVRAMDIVKNTQDGDGETEIPSDSEKPTTPEDDTNPPADDKEDADANHIYTLYPCADVLLLTGVSATTLPDGEDAYKLRYIMAQSGEEFYSVIEADTNVAGAKSSLSQLKSGDVLMMDTAFHGEIGCLYVMASMDMATPSFGSLSTFSRRDDYEVVSGKLSDIHFGSSNVRLTIDSSGTPIVKTIKPRVELNIFENINGRGRWINDSLSRLDPVADDVYILIRYTNGLATEIIVKEN